MPHSLAVAEMHIGVSLIDFYKQDCGPCKLMDTTIDVIEAEFPEIMVAKVDVAAQPQDAARYGVVGFPTIIILLNGSPVFVHVGRMPAARLRDAIKAVLA